MRRLELVGLVGLGLLVVLAVWCVVGTEIARRNCLAAGYPDIRGERPFAVYCLRRVDQTDIMVPEAALLGP